jgi:ubiquinone/menaquinone biosynthesis C-methylase UbiE
MGLDRFDDSADFFDRVNETRLHWRLRRAAAGALEPVAGRRILDLGTGPGGLALDLARSGARVLGLDGSPDMLRRASVRMRRGEAGKEVRLVRGDALHLPLRDDTVEGVTGVLVLHLLDDPVAALRECGRVAAPGGKLALVTQSEDFGSGAADPPDQPLEDLEREFLEGCCESAVSHRRLGRSEWAAAFQAAGLPAPTITLAIPGVAWLLFTCLPGGEEPAAEPGEGVLQEEPAPL